MKLAVKQFYEYRPASQWAFDIKFSNPMVLTTASTVGKSYQLQETTVFTQTDLDRISQCVVSCTQPKFDIDPMTTCYGNFDFTLPIYDVNNIKLTITFEDTDDCLISYKFLSALMGGSTANKIPAWLNVHEAIRITITEYNTYQYDYARPNSTTEQYRNWNVTSVKHYLCKLCEYTEPNYNRTSDSPQATTLKLTFLVIPDGIHIVDNNNVSAVGPEQLDLHGELSKLKENLKKELGNVGNTLKIMLTDKEGNKFTTAKSKIHELGEQVAKFAKEKYNTANVSVDMAREYLTTHTDLYDKSAGYCAAGVTFLDIVTEQANNLDTNVKYVSRGNGSDYYSSNYNSMKADASQIDAAIAHMKPNTHFIISMSGTGKKEGHVVMVSKDSNGVVHYTSDYQQSDARNWRTYSYYSQLEQSGNLKLKILSKKDNNTKALALPL